MAYCLIGIEIIIMISPFALAAIPLYSGRFTGKGVVARSFYGKILHPQYLFLPFPGLA